MAKPMEARRFFAPSSCQRSNADSAGQRESARLGHKDDRTFGIHVEENGNWFAAREKAGQCAGIGGDGPERKIKAAPVDADGAELFRVQRSGDHASRDVDDALALSVDLAGDLPGGDVHDAEVVGKDAEVDQAAAYQGAGGIM